jgi:hypothetical protein
VRVPLLEPQPSSVTHPQYRDDGIDGTSGSRVIMNFMTGIQFVTDAKGRKTAAIIDLRTHKALWEDIEDVLVSRSRRNEKRIPLKKVKADLISSGKLRESAWATTAWYTSSMTWNRRCS